MDFKNKKVVVMGLGGYKDGSGISAALFFLRKGAKLLITDLKTKKELAPQLKRLRNFRNIKYVLGKHRKDDFKKTDYIFKNPGVPKDSPYLKIAQENRIPIINDWTIYFEERPKNLLIGITGTKGKSTIAVFIYQILKAVKKDVVLCGNIGQSPLAILNRIKKSSCIQNSRPHSLYTSESESSKTIVVAELSSWLLHDFKQSPQISIITNLMPEHLDKYKNVREYYRDKENIFRFQNKNDYLILNKNDKNSRKLTQKVKSKIIWYDGKKGNAAIAVAKILEIPQKTAKKAIKIFKVLPGRLELIREKNGIKYYNDTTATMPEATIYALHFLKKYRGRIILIAGGVDKKLDYKNLAKEIPKYCKALILFKGSASEKILSALYVTRYGLQVTENVNSIKQAVTTAKQYTAKGDIILLSPSAASFNLFKNEFDRGEQFVKFVKQLK